MRIQSSIVALFGLCLLVLGCSQSARPGSNRVVQVAQVAGNPPADAGDISTPVTIRKVIYACQIEVIVQDFAVAQQKLATLIESIQAQGGFLARQELSGASSSHQRGSWTIRVPLSQFDGFVAQVEKLGELERNSRDAQDVTEAYTDLEARLRNKQSSEQRLLSHLEQSAQLKDTLELERELSRVRGEVEQLQGQLNLLKSKTDLATVSLTVFQRHHDAPPLPATFPMLVFRVFGDSWKTFVACGQGLVLVSVALFPWAVAAGIIWIVVYVIRKSPRLSARQSAAP